MMKFLMLIFTAMLYFQSSDSVQGRDNGLEMNEVQRNLKALIEQEKTDPANQDTVISRFDQLRGMAFASGRKEDVLPRSLLITLGNLIADNKLHQAADELHKHILSLAHPTANNRELSKNPQQSSPAGRNHEITLEDFIKREKIDPTSQKNIKQRFQEFRKLAVQSGKKETILPLSILHSVKKDIDAGKLSTAATQFHSHIVSLTPSSPRDIKGAPSNNIENNQFYPAKYPARKIPKIDNGSFESSHFGVFAAYMAHSYRYFTSRKGFNDSDFFNWADSHMGDLGAHWTRSVVNLIWDRIEPELGGARNWNAVLADSMLTVIYDSKHHIHWLGVFNEGGNSETEALNQKNNHGRGPLRDPFMHQKEFTDFVKDAVERFDGDGIDDAHPSIKVKYWQVGNEIPRWENKLARTPEEYVKFVRLIRKAAKEADPQSKIVLIAPMNGTEVSSFLRKVIIELAKTKSFDVIDIHHWGRADQWAMPAVAQYRALLDSLGLENVQIWSTENGTWNGTPARIPHFQSQTDQAISLIKRYVFNLNNGLDKLFWNNLIEWHNFMGNSGSTYNYMGLITDGAGTGQNPHDFGREVLAYWSYKKLAEEIDCDKATATGMLRGTGQSENTLYSFGYQRLQDKSKFYISWCEGDECVQNITVEKKTVKLRVTSLIYDKSGVPRNKYEIPVKNGFVKVRIGREPVLIEEISHR